MGGSAVQVSWLTSLTSFFGDTLHEALIATILAIGTGTAVFIYRRFLVEYWERVWLNTTKTFRAVPSRDAGLSTHRRRLLDALRVDQSISGPHYGQFGRPANLEEEVRFQTGGEDIQSKPRMFLTMWPVIVLTQRRLMKSRAALAEAGVRRLMSGGRIRVFQSADANMSPIRLRPLISYRHTMCAAVILHQRTGWGADVRNIVGAMLDEQGGWQNDDGGWAQCDVQFTASDLFSSSYAMR